MCFLPISIYWWWIIISQLRFLRDASILSLVFAGLLLSGVSEPRRLLSSTVGLAGLLGLAVLDMVLRFWPVRVAGLFVVFACTVEDNVVAFKMSVSPVISVWFKRAETWLVDTPRVVTVVDTIAVVVYGIVVDVFVVGDAVVVTKEPGKHSSVALETTRSLKALGKKWYNIINH